MKGTQPPGRMTHRIDMSQSVAGYEGDGMIIITYDFQRGLQVGSMLGTKQIVAIECKDFISSLFVTTEHKLRSFKIFSWEIKVALLLYYEYI